MHTIHNIAFEVDVNHEEQQISWEQYYVDFFQDRLLEKVEKLCNNWDTKYPNTKCSIDEIDINVEVDNLNLEELQEKIITKISDQLNTINKNGATTNGSVRATITSVASPFDALVDYLKIGILPAYISVKIFKEWLGTLEQFTTSEKTTLKALFSSDSTTIERMLSLVRNDYEKFATILQSRQKITKQFIQFEETFFKKFMKAICEKLQITYRETQAEIWFKTLGLSSSLTQFSKTFMQLLIPKAAAQQKRLVNVSEHHLSVTILQAIVQNDMQKSIDISVAKIFDVKIVTKAESSTNEETDKNIDSTTKKDISTNVKSSQKADTITDNQDKNQTSTTKKKDVSSTEKNEESIIENHQNKITSENSIESDSIEKSTHTKNVKESDVTDKIAQNELQGKESTNHAGIVQSSKDETNKNDVKNDSSKKSSLASANQNMKDDNNTSKGVTKSNTGDSEENIKTAQQKNTKTSATEVDRTIFEKLSRNNSPVREIPLTTEKAGLILLNPFLVRFLNGAKLVTEDNEISDIGKAAMLLHFLTTGTEEVTDVELTLEKICLGIPLDTIINYQTPLTAEDKALCEELLLAVIQHWSVLKNSTSNTLRDMFLKREGEITLREDSIKLVVERYAQDILLDKVPWSIGIFQLKWMDKMMHIEW